VAGLGGAQVNTDISQSVTTLKDRLKTMIQASGPISVATYMDLCLHDARHGYYATRPGLGEDFITAPEISQIFGELIGLWLAHEWQVLGEPAQISIVEVGPGRGTLMADALRASAGISGFADALQLYFVEQSPVLRNNLRARFAGQQPHFLDQLDQVPKDHPVLVVANEWLDCLPVQQYVRVGDAWHERVVGLNESQDLTLGLNADALPPEVQPDARLNALELQPGLATLIEALEEAFAKTRGRALFIDYGPSNRIPEDSLRSYQKGEQIDPLAAPGESDLTCDVDFARFNYLARQTALGVSGPVSQSQFLLALGAEARLNHLIKSNPDAAEDLYQGIRKLTDPAEMGERFQAICLSAPDLPVPAAF
jgi:NADH dehydrogenase [ubiquinone] 1 alpha subcomplex assembly factor 7